MNGPTRGHAETDAVDRTTRLLLGSLVVLFLVVACLRPAARSVAPPPPTTEAATTTPSLRPAVPIEEGGLAPDRDLFDLRRRYGLLSDERPQQTPSRPKVLGDLQSFTVLDLENVATSTVTARLVRLTEHLRVYLAEGLTLDDEALARSLSRFETHIYPTLTSIMGTPGPSVDGDATFIVLLTPIHGATGYFSSGDQYPRAVYPNSNEGHLLYINPRQAPPGGRAFEAVLAHEFAHALMWQRDKTEDAWLNEGLAELGADLVGYPSLFPMAYLQDSDVPLLHWSLSPERASRHYGAAYLFLKFLTAGQPPALDVGELVADERNGYASVQGLLSARFGMTFDDQFIAWLVALGRGEAPGLAPGQRPRAQRLALAEGQGRSLTGTVAPYGADYIELAGTGAWRLHFQGSPTLPLIPANVPNGSFIWWSQRGDGLNPRLTRRFDLTGLSQATLSFRLWYDLEANWDYAYVSVSTDEGQSWRALPGRHTTERDPLSRALGPGYTGLSGNGPTAEWVDEQIDLTPFVGHPVLLRFEVVTDDSVSGPGLALDDIAIPELGFADGAETDDGGWTAEGFVRTDNRTPIRFLARLLEESSQGLRMTDVVSGGAISGTLDLRDPGRQGTTVLVISALNPATELPASYELLLTPQ